jgi:hypothetical protein
MRGSVLSRAMYGGLMHRDGGLSEERKNQWFTPRISRKDVRLMREMYEAGWAIRRIGRIFGLNWDSTRDICLGRKYREHEPRPQAGLGRIADEAGY